MQEFNYTEFLDGVGVDEGDIVDVASDLLSIMVFCREKKLKFDPNHLIDALIEMVGKDGTIMIRTFTWAFCKGLPFDIRTSPSEVGSLGNVAMKRSDFLRTKHPIYSWAVRGKYKDVLCEMENTDSFGKESVLNFLYQKKAKMLRIGNISHWAITQMHYAEAIAQVPYRYMKEFTGKYFDGEGHESVRTYTMYVRTLDYDVKNIDPLGLEPDWRQRGVVVSKDYYGLECNMVKLREASDDMYFDIKNNYGKNICVIRDQPGFEHILDDNNVK